MALPFKVGKKELFLPNFIITFLRNQTLPANYARFEVPLWFSKLDLRDYLYHAYNVRIFSVTSYVKQQRARFGAPGGEENQTPMMRKWHRPRAKKFMTVQLERPFVWPEEPEDLTAWDKETVEAQRGHQEAERDKMMPTADTLVNEDRRKSMKEQARALLEGREKWEPRGREKNLTSMMARR
ncbi:hypothetical protein BDY17DRAFT_250558 [Neohortaea acidophila]|uniref:Large ribosomal subunit protein uL23m n=1 Tax=Neohortaea acidophila TaxID=245834 RepID=A0A6A6PUP7_9PEZI|nr:uncharacterized protein BDY17DRAFT_250558 [Neohortaea acidophila]KAF2483153.1 hypothetical protein BDY17DRAFT_250558 [Neohortaea acidophila]